MPEWLSGMTRNHVGSARAGSNPAAHVLCLQLIFLNFPTSFLASSFNFMVHLFMIIDAVNFPQFPIESRGKDAQSICSFSFDRNI